MDDGGTGGPAVLFVHSLAGGAAHWEAQLEHLRGTRRAVAFDVRGHGGSDRPADGDYAIASLAGDVAAVADGLGLGPFVLVGHSMGGGVALSYAGYSFAADSWRSSCTTATPSVAASNFGCPANALKNAAFTPIKPLEI